MKWLAKSSAKTANVEESDMSGNEKANGESISWLHGGVMASANVAA
jgi:hypothetical protein